jgi:hypothetical protein
MRADGLQSAPLPSQIAAVHARASGAWLGAVRGLISMPKALEGEAAEPQQARLFNEGPLNACMQRGQPERLGPPDGCAGEAWQGCCRAPTTAGGGRRHLAQCGFRCEPGHLNGASRWKQ